MIGARHGWLYHSVWEARQRQKDALSHARTALQSVGSNSRCDGVREARQCYGGSRGGVDDVCEMAATMSMNARSHLQDGADGSVSFGRVQRLSGLGLPNALGQLHGVR